MLKWIATLGTLLILPIITNMQEALDDFEVPVEITTKTESFSVRSPLNLKRTMGRTRKIGKYVYEGGANSEEVNITLKGTMSDQYCCFWINQKHPAVSETWKHLKEYPFDFLFNGVFVKNKRDNSERKENIQTYFG
ncbi:uncharacterized protein Dana_GF26368 [Drosophila ananassae]|uniref:Uncharacterized protein n=1 Tax=Drosophila ananassae TaxID=7217 RepID=A0A0P8XX49_DROAN|nr:uncharacterized protein LOC26513777 [Drosophila ananassae]KPU79270.1 uncharacterized protein Dana_GF26368 [Drosophila ananassae]